MIVDGADTVVLLGLAGGWDYGLLTLGAPHGVETCDRGEIELIGIVVDVPGLTLSRVSSTVVFNLILCQAGMAMPRRYTYWSKTTLEHHERGRHVCPLLWPEMTGEVCPSDHKQWSKDGCTTGVYQRKRRQRDCKKQTECCVNVPRLQYQVQRPKVIQTSCHAVDLSNLTRVWWPVEQEVTAMVRASTVLGSHPLTALFWIWLASLLLPPILCHWPGSCRCLHDHAPLRCADHPTHRAKPMTLSQNQRARGGTNAAPSCTNYDRVPRMPLTRLR
jgi:hypothetical protein